MVIVGSEGGRPLDPFAGDSAIGLGGAATDGCVASLTGGHLIGAGGRSLKARVVSNQVVALLRVLGRVVELVDAASTLVGAPAAHRSARRVSVPGHHLGAHVSPHLFSFFASVLQVLGRSSRVVHSSRNGRMGRDSTGNGSLALVLHLLLSKLGRVAFLLEDPVVLPVVFPAIALHQRPEEAAEVVVVGAFLEVEVLAVLQVLGELFGRVATQLLNCRLNLLLLDAVILVVLVLACEALPRQCPLQEVKQDVAD